MGRSKGKSVLFFSIKYCLGGYTNWSTVLYETSKFNKVQLMNLMDPHY